MHNTNSLTYLPIYLPTYIQVYDTEQDTMWSVAMSASDAFLIGSSLSTGVTSSWYGMVWYDGAVYVCKY